MQESNKMDRNVDIKDMENLESLSSEWWDPKGPAKALHMLTPLRVSFIIDGLIRTGVIKADDKNKPDVLKGLNILEVGCAGGVLAEALAKLKANVTGLDPSTIMLDVARDHLNGQSFNVDYVCGSIQDYSTDNIAKYDVVVATEVLEHVPDHKAFLIESIKCLKPNGSIFFTTFNKTKASWIFGILIAEYILGIIPRGTHEWNYFIGPKEVTKIIKKEGCKTVFVRGIWYDPFFQINRFTKYHGISYALHAVKDSN